VSYLETTVLVGSSTPDLLAGAWTLDFKQDIGQWLVVFLLATDDASHRAHYDRLIYYSWLMMCSVGGFVKSPAAALSCAFPVIAIAITEITSHAVFIRVS
jgi:hypothetical protein